MPKTPKAVKEQTEKVMKEVCEQETKMKNQKTRLNDTLKEVNDLQKKYDSLEKEIQKATAFCLKKSEILKQMSSKLNERIEESKRKQKEIAEVKNMIKNCPKSSFGDIAPTQDKLNELKSSIKTLLQDQQKTTPNKEKINEELLTVQNVISDIKKIACLPKSAATVKRPAKEDHDENKRQRIDQPQSVKVEPVYQPQPVKLEPVYKPQPVKLEPVFELYD